MATSRKPAAIFIFITLVIAIMGIGLILPVLPGLVTEFEGGDVAQASHVYGWLVGIFAMMQFLGSPILGALSDRFGRRRVILISLAGSAVDYVVMALAPTLAWLFVARAVAGLTAGILATTNAYVADVTPPEDRAKAFGMVGAAFGLGFILGPAFGGLLGEFGLRVPFWAAAGLAALNCLYGVFVLPESLTPENRREFKWSRANPVGTLLALRRFPAVFGLAGAHFIMSVAQMMTHSVWVLFMGFRFGWTTLEVGASLAVAGATSIVVQAGLVKPIIGRIGERRGFVLAGCVAIVAMTAYGFATHGWMIYAILVFASIAGIGGPALQSYITRHVPPDEQGSLQGAFASLMSVAGIVGPPIAALSFGWAIDPANTIHIPGLPFFESAVLLAIAVALAVRSFNRATARAATQAQA
ncbi:MAG TPA: TCR/Tet family MFS transporter [Opitutaceae bacterium]|nr:TCR/Tet family MFS transporter [Opitutaceae bacterium]